MTHTTGALEHPARNLGATPQDIRAARGQQ